MGSIKRCSWLNWRLPRLFAVIALIGFEEPVFAADAPRSDFERQVDSAVSTVLARTGAPSCSIALVRNGAIVYARAYGLAQLEPQRRATPEMRYAIGSISKEFTAAALLMLQERGALSIDKPAGDYLPDLGPAGAVSIRQLLSHTAGVRDYWPQDYDLPGMLDPVSSKEILARWGRQPLDFTPGSAWQYSNTGFTIAGLIAERVAHQSLFSFWQLHIFQPLRLESAFNFDAGPLPSGDAAGYTHYALGPSRPAAKTGRGWLFAAGPLAMSASDLARWDIALMDHRLLTDASYRDLTTEVRLTTGVGTGYALGLGVALESGRRVWKHAGEVTGFTAQNRMYPDLSMALVVLVNEDMTTASTAIADEIAKILLAQSSPADVAADAEATRLFRDLQNGHIDESRLTPNARSYFTVQALADFHSSLSPLGDPQQFVPTRLVRRGGLVIRYYDITFADRKLAVIVQYTPDGHIEQFTVSAK